METGYIQVYTGNGKGKTTAALGLAIRAAGAGMRVFIGQFMKMGDYSEIQALKRFSDQITVEQYGAGRFVRGNPSPEERQAAAKGLERIRQVLIEGHFNLIILDEANVAVTCGLIAEEDLCAIMDAKPAHVELVLTGRGARQRVMEKADLVTEMQNIRHYYEKGVPSRIGIEK